MFFFFFTSALLYLFLSPLSERLNWVNRQPSNGQKCNRQLSKKGKFYSLVTIHGVITFIVIRVRRWTKNPSLPIQGLSRASASVCIWWQTDFFEVILNLLVDVAISAKEGSLSWPLHILLYECSRLGSNKDGLRLPT